MKEVSLKWREYHRRSKMEIERTLRELVRDNWGMLTILSAFLFRFEMLFEKLREQLRTSSVGVVGILLLLEAISAIALGLIALLFAWDGITQGLPYWILPDPASRNFVVCGLFLLLVCLGGRKMQIAFERYMEGFFPSE